MATGTIKINTVKSGTLYTSNISTTSGTVISSSWVRYSYDDNYISISYYIRLKDTTGRPTVTVTGLPNMGSGFLQIGHPTVARIGANNEVSDATYASASGTTLTIDMYNFIGSVPDGTGYMIYGGSFVAPIAP